MKYAPLPASPVRRNQGLRPAGAALNAIVTNLRAPLDLKAPRKLEAAK